MKTVLVTGATRGLGLAVTRRLTSDGFRILATARRQTQEFEELKRAHSEQVVFEPFDMSDMDGIHPFVSRLSKDYGAFYGLINNAAVGLDGVLPTMHNRDIQTTVNVNVLAPIVLTKYVSRAMIAARQKGRIVNISSIIATTGFSGLSVYAATKAAMIGFTRSLSRELGRTGVTVNAVAPGYMETSMTADLQGDKLNTIRRRSPLGELATVDDVSGAVSYLLSPDARMVTGTVVTVDGGSTA